MKIPGLDSYKEKWGIGSRSVIEPGLDRIERVLAQLCHPERHDKIIHVSGTNGKGSTIAFLKAICEAHDINYGTFQSPAIIDVHDQTTINGVHVTPEQMNDAMEKISHVDEVEQLTDFELLTIAAFVIFSKLDLDVWFIETGMGGRLDSTNVIPSSTAVITSLALEHTNFLGNTLDEIGEHKAGIIKQDSNVFLPETIYIEPFLKEAQLKNARIHIVTPIDKDVKLSLLGNHQRMNASLAVSSLSSLFSLDHEKIKEALGQAYIPFRMERIAENVYLDGAHNPAAARALVDTIKTNFKDQQIHIVMGILKDKDYETVLRILEEVADQMTFVDFSHERALESKRLVEFCRLPQKKQEKLTELDINSLIKEKNMTILTGSLYFLTEWRFKNSK